MTYGNQCYLFRLSYLHDLFTLPPFLGKKIYDQIAIRQKCTASVAGGFERHHAGVLAKQRLVRW
jgi:hypothetical protein